MVQSFCLPHGPVPCLPHGPVPCLPHGPVLCLPHGPVPFLPHGPVPCLPNGPVPWLPHGPVPWLPHGSIPCPPLVQSLYSLSALKTFSSVVLLFLVDKEGNKEDNRFYLAGITRLRGEHCTTPPPAHVLNTRAEKCYGGWLCNVLYNLTMCADVYQAPPG